MSLAGVTGRMLARHGRPMTLRRIAGTGPGYAEATVQGHLTSYRPNEIAGLVKQGDARVTIGPSIGPIAPPLRAADQLVVDGRTWAVQGATPRYSGGTLVGWELHVRGGA